MRTLQQIEIDLQDALCAFRSNPRGDTIHKMSSLISVVQYLLHKNHLYTTDLIKSLSVLQDHSAEFFRCIVNSLEDGVITEEELKAIGLAGEILKELVDNIVIQSSDASKFLKG